MRTKRKISFFNRFIWFFTILAALCSGIAILAQYISPAKIWILSLFGFTFFTFYVINFVLFIYWSLHRRKYLILPLIMLLAGLKNVTGIMQFNIPENNKKAYIENNGVKIMSYNVRLFDLYNWTKNLETRSKIFDLLTDELPDILCIQEFYNSDIGDFQNLDTLLKIQKARYFHMANNITLRNVDHWGMATLSYYPIVNKGEIKLGEEGTNNMAIYSDIKIHDDTLRVYNVHLQSIKFQYKDYDYVQKMEEKNHLPDMQGSKVILGRLKGAFVKRAAQAELLRSHMESSPYPVVICGDFNDTPVSYVYNVLSDNLKDAFQQSGFGFGRTYAGIFPSFRIDYILHDKKFKSSDYNTIHKPYSDHYPITCTIYMKN
ncbi:MAG: endonuclease/exonuclease/phosphatase family protein [Bacteroidia bacterium]